MSGAPGSDLIDAEWLVQHLPDGAQPAALADLIASAIESGQLRRGARLPTIREISSASGLAFRTISDAWAQLRSRGLIETRRRGGSFVAARNTDGGPQPTSAPSGGGARLDLGRSTADPALLPDLQPAVSFGLQAPNLHSSVREFITPRLSACARRVWPYDAQSFIASGSGAEAALLSVLGVTPAGGAVAVDQPANPGFLGSLRSSGLRVVGVTADSDGPLPDSLSAALAAGAATYAFQATSPYSPGSTISEERLAVLAEVLATASERVMIVEEDACGPLAGSPSHSFGPWLPERVVHVRSFCKSYGVDLRTSLISGSHDAVQAIQSQRSTGLAVTSRILQDALAYLLESVDTADVMDRARQQYAARRAACLTALARHGVTATCGPDGQFLWIEVEDELETILRLADEGITVGAGSECHVDAAVNAIRVATMRLPDEPAALDELALTIADVVRGPTVNYYV